MRVRIEKLPPKAGPARQILRDVQLSDEVRAVHELVKQKLSEQGFTARTDIVVKISKMQKRKQFA